MYKTVVNCGNYIFLKNSVQRTACSVQALNTKNYCSPYPLFNPVFWSLEKDFNRFSHIFLQLINLKLQIAKD